MKIAALIPAAGSGKRFGSEIKKQFVSLRGKPILIHVLERFLKCAAISRVIVIVSPEDRDEVNGLLEKFNLFARVEVISGGKERYDSVYCGLKLLSKEFSHVLIHDGARPLISDLLLRRCVDALDRFDGFITAIPSRDTVKRVKGTLVQDTLKRSELVLVQTPQGFNREKLLYCYEQMDFDSHDITDDASLFEFFNYDVHVIEGDVCNIKVTYPIDQIYGESILAAQEDESCESV